MTKTFAITPASSTPFVVLLAIGVLLILLLAFFVFTAYSARNMRFEVNDQGLQIKGGIYGRFIPKEEIVDDGVKIINLNAQTEYKPRIRTNGIGLPGYKEGWFKLKNSEKALLFVTDYSKVVYIPTSKDYSILLSINNADAFRQSIELWE